MTTETRTDQLTATLDAILALQDECGQNNWDGYGALPVATEAIAQAILFVNALPDDVPMPEANGENDGEVGLMWLPAKSRTMWVSVGKAGVLNYAWLLDGDSGHGVVTFDGTTVPEVILSGIRRVRG